MNNKFKRLYQLFFAYLKIGLFTFGGGYAMISLIEEEIVHKKEWLTKDELTDIVTIAESTPGPIAINCATYVGYKRAGVLGSAMATLGVVIPSFVIIFLISLFFDAFLSIQLVAYAFMGIKCAVGLIILRTGVKMMGSFKKTPLAVTCNLLAIAGILVIDILAVRFSTVYFVLIGIVIGLVCYFVAQHRESAKAASDNGEGGAAQ